MSGPQTDENPEPPGRHDHVDIVFAGMVLRYHDPRRFGVIDWQPGEAPELHPLLAVLGIEPRPCLPAPGCIASAAVGGDRSRTCSWTRANLVGVGEHLRRRKSLPGRYFSFAAGGSPGDQVLRAFGRRCARDARRCHCGRGEQHPRLCPSRRRKRLVPTDLRRLWTRRRACRRCGSINRLVRQGGRSTFYCPHRQR